MAKSLLKLREKQLKEAEDTILLYKKMESRFDWILIFGYFGAWIWVFRYLTNGA